MSLFIVHCHQLSDLAFLFKAQEPVWSDQGLEVETPTQTSQEECVLSISEDKGKRCKINHLNIFYDYLLESPLLKLKESSAKESESGKGTWNIVYIYRVSLIHSSVLSVGGLCYDKRFTLWCLHNITKTSFLLLCYNHASNGFLNIIIVCLYNVSISVF